MGMLLLAFALLAARVVASENLTGANLLRVRVTSDCQTLRLFSFPLSSSCVLSPHSSSFIMTSFCFAFNGFAVASLSLIQGWVRAISTHWFLHPSHCHSLKCQIDTE